MPRTNVTLLGGFGAWRDGGAPMRFDRRKAIALLAYLACHGGQVHPRDKLSALLWPDVPAAQARHSLRQILASLRGALPRDALRVDDAGVGLEPDSMDVDVVTFRRLVADGTPAALAQAAAVYAGDLLAGIDIRDAGPFEEWLQSEREALHELALGTFARLLAGQREANDVPGALHTALRLLAIDPLQEVVHRTVMRLQAAQGRRDAALRQYQVCVDLLQRELGVEPEAETQRLYSEILRQREHSGDAARDAQELDSAARARTEPAHDVDSWDAPTPIIGRELELAALDQALAESVPGRQRLLVLLGEAGIGKSRVLAEFRGRVVAKGARVLLGRSYESAQIVPFGPWIDALRRGGAAEEAAVRGLEPVWRRELTRLLPELGEHVQDLAEAPNDAGRLFESVARLLEHLAGQQPVVVLLEDVHWADETSVRLLAALVRRRRRVPLVLAASARDDELHDAAVLRTVLSEIAGEQRLERLVLAPLSKIQTTALTHHLVRVGSDPATVAALAERLWDASRGHPFMIVESMAALEQGSGVAVQTSVPVPERVREIIVGRLGRLTERARALVSVAAVIGREFDFPLLHAAAGADEHETATAVEELVRRRILRLADESFDFTHDRIREVAFAEILPPRRRILHREVADALQALRTEARDPDWAELAAHRLEAGLWTQAAQAFREAGRTASIRSAEREAAACFEAALAALARAPESRSVLQDTVDINLELRNSLLVAGEIRRLPPCLAAAEAAARALEDDHRLAWVSLFIAQLHWWGGLSPDARVFAEQAEQIATASTDRSLQAIGNLYAGFAWYNAGDCHRANRCLGRTLALLESEPAHRRHGHQSLPIPMALAHLARSHSLLGNTADAVRHGRQALRLAEGIGHAYSVVVALSGLAELAMATGHFHDAIQLFERVETLARDLQMAAHATAGLGYALALVGRVAEGTRLLESERAAMDASGWGLMKARMLGSLAHVYVIAGRLDEADACGREALDLARHRGERGAEAWALWALGESASRREPRPADPASALYREALGLGTDLGLRPLIAYCHLGLGQLFRRANHPEADEHLARATALAREMDVSLWISPTESLRGR